MQTSFGPRFCQFILFVNITTSAPQLLAQAFTSLHALPTGDGKNPNGSLLASENVLYGTAESGGALNKGSLFALRTDGSGFTNLHSFTGQDGVNPQAGLIRSENTLYGTTKFGGVSGNGAVFAVYTDGSAFTNLSSFSAGSGSSPTITNADGANPSGGLVLSKGVLYGTTTTGGTSGAGAIFAVNVDGTGFRNLHSFASGEGATPNGLLLSGDVLYGTAYSGGESGLGALFSIRIDGTEFTNLHSFEFASGAFPMGSLTLSGKTLYGTTSTGGSSLNGTVFAIDLDGNNFITLHNFTGEADGAFLQGGLVLWGSTLYGSASRGGDFFGGTVFGLETNGTGFTTLHAFIGGSDGASPLGALILVGNTLYGTTWSGGRLNNGTIFGLQLIIQLSITPYSGNLILAWPTHPAGFTLQTATNISSPIWTPVSPAPAVLNDQNIVIQAPSKAHQLYRLSQ